MKHKEVFCQHTISRYRNQSKRSLDTACPWIVRFETDCAWKRYLPVIEVLGYVLEALLALWEAEGK